MKTAAVLLIAFRLCLSIPVNGNALVKAGLSPETDSEPIALLFLVLPQLQELRDHKDYNQDSNGLSIFDLLFQDAEIPFHSEIKQIEDPKGLKETKSREGQNESNINPDEPITLIEDRIVTIPFDTRKMEVHVQTILKSLPFTVTEQLHREDKNTIVRNVNELIKAFEDSFDHRKYKSSVTIEDTPTIAEDSLERLKNLAYSAFLRKHITKSLLQILNYATDPNIDNNLEATSINKTMEDIKDSHLKEFHDSHHKTSSDVNRIDDVNLKRVVKDLNSPAPMIASDRSKRRVWDTGATHYKVSEDFPETFKGNHHVVSVDYPQPNMIKLANYDEIVHNK